MTEGEPNVPDQEIFTLTDVDHELTNKFQPQFVARGGEHVVYDIEGHPDIVAKASVDSLTSLLKENLVNGDAPDYFGESQKMRAEAYLQEEHRRYQQLREYFGKKHTLALKKYCLKVPVTPQILNEVFEGKSPTTPIEAWAVVAIQKRSKALEDPEHLSLVAGYSEEYEVDPDIYKDQTDQLFIHPEGNEFDLEDFKKVQPKKRLLSLLEDIDQDTQLQDVMKDFVEKSIQYTSKTGETLDLAGTDNVAIYQKDGKWSYELLDALYPVADMVAITQAAIIKLAQGQEISDQERNRIMNTINYVRTINGLAKYLGVEERIDIVPSEAKDANIDYLEEIKKHLSNKEKPK